MAKARAGSNDGTSSKKRTLRRGRVTAPGGQVTAASGKATPTSGKATPTSGKATAPSGKATAPSGRATPPSGRATPPKSRDVNKRYTAPIPKSVRHSPRWFGPVLLALLIIGLLMIVGNYVGIMPGGTSNWYLIGGLVGIVVGAMMATQYH